MRVGAGAFVSHNVEIGAGTHIGHGAIVHTSVVERNVLIGSAVVFFPSASGPAYEGWLPALSVVAHRS